MKSRIILVNPFDAYAGSQRVASRLVSSFQSLGYGCDILSGFGGSGFLADLNPSFTFSRTENIRKRKALYPFWIILSNFLIMVALIRRRQTIAWANTIYAVPSLMMAMIFFPRKLVIHIHENDFPAILRHTLRFASRRGARILAVSAYHARKLGLGSINVLPNAVGDAPPPDHGPGSRLLFVGSAQPMKGLPLFREIVAELQHADSLKAKPVAYLAGLARDASAEILSDLAETGIQAVFGETRTEMIFADGWLYLQLTDPALADETFSLVTAEAVWHCVPVGAAGADVVNEVAAGAIAFNIASRDARAIAEAILNLQNDPDAYARLVAGCEERRKDYAQHLYQQRVDELLRAVTA